MKQICIVVLVLVSTLTWAQDNIVFRDGTEQKGKVQEISTYEVVYQKADNPDGPVYRIDRNTVFLIQFENGTSEVVTPIDFMGATSVTNTNGRPRAFGGEYRSPGMAFLFSFLLPGGGQYYNRQYGKGGAMTALWLGGIVTTATAPFGYEDCYFYGDDPYYYQEPGDPNIVDDPGFYDPYYYPTCSYSPHPQRVIGNVVWAGTWLWSMIDAPISAAKINRRNAEAGTAGILDFQLKNNSSLHLRPFRSQGIGGAIALNF